MRESLGDGSEVRKSQLGEYQEEMGMLMKTEQLKNDMYACHFARSCPVSNMNVKVGPSGLVANWSMCALPHPPVRSPGSE